MIVLDYAPQTTSLRKLANVAHIQNTLANFGHRAISSHILEVNERNSIRMCLKILNGINPRVGGPVHIQLDLYERGISGLKQIIKQIVVVYTSKFKVVVMIAKGNAMFLASLPDGIQARSKCL